MDMAGQVEKEPMVRVPADNLKSFCTEVFLAEGVPSPDAEIFADTLTSANLRGVDSHGVMRLSMYVERFRKGGTSRTTPLEIVSDSTALTMMDAKNGIGQVASYRAMEAGIRRAGETGFAGVGVRNSNHFGMAAYYAMMALPQNMIGIAASNTTVNMTTSTSAKAGVANNPWSAAVPAGIQRPVVIDMASSIVAAGKLMNAVAKGERVPLGWGVDADGRPTDDPSKILQGGSLLPFGGYKGYAIALLIDILTGVFTGAGFGAAVASPTKERSKPTDCGHFFIAIDVRQVAELEEFKSRMDALIGEIKALPPAEGVDRVRIPGEFEFEAQQDRAENGIPVPTATIEDLKKTGELVGVAWK
jgi:LDH2 family malate/lactate/ureidoglycolate dehydrogenase